MRTESDSFGELELPTTALYGVHSLRSRENFDVAGEPLPRSVNHAMATLKRACAEANRKLGLLSDEKTDAIVTACDKVRAGEADDAFIVDIFQAGSGTSSNMNTNEVLANLACIELGGQPGDRDLVHPNDDVNKGQSTNNIFPSGIKVAAVESTAALITAGQELASDLREKAEAFSTIMKSGRTHLQDAVPVTVGQGFAAYARAVEKSVERVAAARARCLELGVGGNAIGTGINTTSDYREKIIAELKDFTGEPYRVAEDGIEITQFLTDLGDLSSAVRLLALDILKITNDLRLLASGPKTGIRELVLPPVEPGSSIMPGKINPSICEAANMACLQVVGNDHAVSVACGLGQLELNTHMPLIATNLLKSIGIMERCCRMVGHKCVRGITVNEDVCRYNFEESAGLATVLNPKLGYDAVSALVKEGLKTGKNLKTLVLEKDIMPEEELEALLAKSAGPTL